MKRILLLSVIVLMTTNVFSQSVESIVKRVSNEICDCVGDIEDESELREKLKKCSDDKINYIMNNSTKAENAVLLEGDNLRKVISQLESYVLTHCDKVKKLLKQNLDKEVNEVSQNKNITPFPTNFSGKDLKKINKLDGKIIAFEGLVTEVNYAPNSKPYYKVQLEDGSTIWIASLVKSGFEKKGKIIRLLGYVSSVGDDKIAKKYNKTAYHILAFSVIDLDSKKMSMLPGSEKQVKEWMNGTIPKGGK